MFSIHMVYCNHRYNCSTHIFMSQKKHREERQQERKRMEELKEKVERLEEFVSEIEDRPDGPYFSCSLGLEHDDDCVEGSVTNPEDGSEHPFRYFEREGMKFPCGEVDKWDVAISHEEVCWRVAEMSTSNVVTDTYEMNIVVNSLIQVLVEKLGIDVDELNEMFKKNKFEALRGFRLATQEQIKQQRVRASILGADGRPVNGHLN